MTAHAAAATGSGITLGLGALQLGVTLGGTSANAGATTLLGVNVGGTTGSTTTQPPLVGDGLSLGGSTSKTGFTTTTPLLVGRLVHGPLHPRGSSPQQQHTTPLRSRDEQGVFPCPS